MGAFKIGTTTIVSNGTAITGTSIDVSGNSDANAFRIDGTQVISSGRAATFTTVDTGQGANKLYDMDQNVTETSSPTFSKITLVGNGVSVGSSTASKELQLKATQNDIAMWAGGDIYMFPGGNYNINSADVHRADTNIRWAWFESGHSGGGDVANIKMDSQGYLSVTSSDARMKNSGELYSNALDKINQLKPRYFKWKEGFKENTEENNLGFIAQEVENILPEAVTLLGGSMADTVDLGEEGGPKRDLNERALLAALTTAVQELSAKVDALENK